MSGKFLEFFFRRFSAVGAAAVPFYGKMRREIVNEKECLAQVFTMFMCNLPSTARTMEEEGNMKIVQTINRTLCGRGFYK